MSAGSHRDMGSSIGFGMIGSGGRARIHAEAIRSSATGTRAVAISGGTRACGFGSDHEIPVERSTDALLARSDVDAVVIATPHMTHLSLVEAAAAAAKHVFLTRAAIRRVLGHRLAIVGVLRPVRPRQLLPRRRASRHGHDD